MLLHVFVALFQLLKDKRWFLLIFSQNSSKITSDKPIW